MVDVAKKYRTKPRDGNWYEVEVITTRRLDGQSIERLRVTLHPGRHYQGDYGTPTEMANAMASTSPTSRRSQTAEPPRCGWLQLGS